MASRTAGEQASMVGAGEGELVWFLGNRTTIKATAQTTGGSYGLVESWIPARFSPPLHVHSREDEAFWVLEGNVTFCCGDRTFGASPGSYILLPRGIPHTFLVGDATAHLLTLVSPGGMERFFVEAGRPTEGDGLPPSGAVDVEMLKRVGARFGLEIVGPPMA